MPVVHTLRQGETITHLALRSGHLQQTIWNAEANASLRATRCDMNALRPGDAVTIPDKRPKSLDAATGQRHVFRRNGIPAKWRLQVIAKGKRVANSAYQFRAGGSVIEGKTDADGVIEQWINLDVVRAVLLLDAGDDEVIRLDVNFGALQASEDATGILQRLVNLGYAGSESSDDERLRAALLRFQRSEGLEASGVADQATLARLRELHDTRALKAAP